MKRQTVVDWPLAPERTPTRSIVFMSDQPVEGSGDDSDETPSTAAPSVRKHVRRTLLSTGFSEIPGKTCEVCGFQGFRWQTECPDGHPLA